jgi:hypothetical protein
MIGLSTNHPSQQYQVPDLVPEVICQWASLPPDWRPSTEAYIAKILDEMETLPWGLEDDNDTSRAWVEALGNMLREVLVKSVMYKDGEVVFNGIWGDSIFPLARAAGFLRVVAHGPGKHIPSLVEQANRLSNITSSYLAAITLVRYSRSVIMEVARHQATRIPAGPRWDIWATARSAWETFSVFAAGMVSKAGKAVCLLCLPPLSILTRLF